MKVADIVGALEACERALEREGQPDLKALGFWRIVAAAKRDPALVETYGVRIGNIDRAAFQNWALVKVRSGVGTAFALAATVVGLALVAVAYYVSEPWNAVWILVGTAVLLVTTHGLAHLAVGRLVGIRFTHWFVATLLRPQPGVKTDYATYLRASARHRAVMHAAGAVATKLIPLAMIGAVWAANAPLWTAWALLGTGGATAVTDAVWSVRNSDWKKVRRELRFVRFEPSATEPTSG